MPREVVAFDVLEGDPEAAFAFATVSTPTMDGCRSAAGDIGFAFEACAVFGILGQMRGEDFERVVARQPGVAGQVHLAHPAGAQFALDGVAGEHVAGTEPAHR